jgi:hypothetical protein
LTILDGFQKIKPIKIILIGAESTILHFETTHVIDDDIILNYILYLITFDNERHCVARPIPDKKKLHDLSPRANYTDRTTAACRQSNCQLFADGGCHVVSVTDTYGRSRPTTFFRYPIRLINFYNLPHPSNYTRPGGLLNT